MTITRKYVLLLLVGIVLVQAVSAVIRVRREVGLVREDVARHEQLLGRALSHAVAGEWRGRGEHDALALVERIDAQEPLVTIRWVWPLAKPGSRYAPSVPASKLAGLVEDNPLVVRRAGTESGFYTFIPVTVPDGRTGAIEISESLEAEYGYMRNTVTTVTLTALTLALLIAGIAWALGSRLIGRPMRELVEQARRVGSGDLARRLHLERGDEIGQLAHEMDRMCDGLETAWGRVRSETQARFAALEQLRHADRLMTVGTLASGVAHELGTPINVIDGHAQLLREDPSASDGQKDHAAVIARQCKRMTAIIRQLLDFARRGGPVEGPCDLRAVARDTLRMVEPMARGRKVELALEPGDDAVWAQIGAEPMQQILANLVLNGIDAMPAGGSVRVAISRPGPSEVQIDIEDTGEGMDEATSKRIFEPFFTTKEVGKGTGLGLSVAHGIVQDNRGRIELETQPGHGSRFSVIVPAGTP